MVEKLANMSVDEFLEHGLDSEGEEEEEEEMENEEEEVVEHSKENNENEETKDIKSKSASSNKHKTQLDSLKEKDPSFYKFLQENDEELLEFSDEGDEDESDDDDDDDVEKEKKKTLDEASSDEQSDNDADGEQSDGEELSDKEGEEADEDEDEEGKEDESKGKKVTENMIKRWTTGLEENSLKSLKLVLHAFHAAVQSLSPDEEDESEEGEKKKKGKEKHRSKYVVKSASMYNTLMKMCLKHSIKVLEKNLTPAKQKKFNSTRLPSSSKLWTNIKIPLKHYLLDILQLLRVHTDVSVLTILLRHCQALSPYFACFPKISKMLLKRLTRMWCSGEEHVRVIAFLCIRSLSMLLPSLFEYVLKKLYLGFVRNSKFVNMITKPFITFMKNSLVEMFSLNEAATYKHGFLYIRQLAITLRNAITLKKKDSVQTVYNWQYISCLQLWSQVVSDLNVEALKPLIYPIVQINLGVIKLIPSAKYYPLRFHCVESLNYISRRTGVYIPTASYVLEALESNGFLQRPKSTEKVPDFAGVLKISKSQLSSKVFQDSTIDIAFELLLDHYAIFSHSIAFPELIFPVCRRLKRFIKTSRAVKPCQDMKMLVDKLQLHGDTIQKARDLVTFSPKELELVKTWEEERKSSGNKLCDFLVQWRKMKSVADSVRPKEDTTTTTAATTKSTTTTTATADDQQETDGKKKADKRKTDTDKSNNVTMKKKKKKKTEERKFEDDNDIVEEYKLSDDE